MRCLQPQVSDNLKVAAMVTMRVWDIRGRRIDRPQAKIGASILQSRQAQAECTWVFDSWFLGRPRVVGFGVPGPGGGLVGVALHDTAMVRRRTFPWSRIRTARSFRLCSALDRVDFKARLR